MAGGQRSLWYWAWLVQMTVPKGHRRDASARSQVWRNLVLVRAGSEREALSKAEAIGRRSTGDAGGTLVLNGQPAESFFVGIADAGLVDYELGDGVEVMFEVGVQTRRGARGLARPRPALLARLAHETRQLKASRSNRIPDIVAG
jgi:Domain of unknown function (DUF4288)